MWWACVQHWPGWGRRRPFLLFGFIPFAIVFAMMWWRPPIQSQIGLTVYYGAIYVLYDTIATFVYMPYFALTPELAADYDERTALTSYRMAFSILGSLIAFTIPLLIVGSFRPENTGQVWVNGLVFACISALPLLVVFWGTREHPEIRSEAQTSLRDSLHSALGNRPFLFSAGIFLLTWSALDIVQAVLLYFIRYWLHLEGYSDAIFGVIFVTALLVLPVWEWASRRTNKRLAYMIGIAFWAVVQIVLVLVRPGLPLWIILGLAALAGVGVSAAHILPWSMIPDSIEWDELQTGQRHEGMFYSLVLLMQKAASGIALFLVGLILEWSGYVANADVQTPGALLGIRLLTGAAPALLFCAGIGFAALYPISRSDHAAVRQELAQRRLAGHREGGK
jgi:GPH family glycoside/pentoside/hexuronide:cation symporter